MAVRHRAGTRAAQPRGRRRTIYSAILEGHLAAGGFDGGVARLGGRLVDAMLELHRNVMNSFLPSAVKFHYQFNLRELSNITQARPRAGLHAVCQG
jgi:dynein heavy chain